MKTSVNIQSQYDYCDGECTINLYCIDVNDKQITVAVQRLGRVYVRPHLFRRILQLKEKQIYMKNIENIEPIIDLEALLLEVQDMIEERRAIEGDYDGWY